MSDIYAAMSAVMNEVDHVAKRDKNTYQNFSFRGIDAVVNAIGPALRKHNVVVMPTSVSTEYTSVPVKSGNATVCRVNATYTFYAQDGSSLSTQVASETFDSGDKATPKAMSVAFRIALLQAFALPTDEADPDSYTYERVGSPQNANTGGSGAPWRQPTDTNPWEQAGETETGEMLSEKQSKMIHRLANKLELDHDDQVRGYSHVVGRDVSSSTELTKQEASQVIEAMMKRAGETDE